MKPQQIHPQHRPMPDMTAFDSINHRNHRRHDTMLSSPVPETPLKMCPPTPIKTPDSEMQHRHFIREPGSKSSQRSLSQHHGLKQHHTSFENNSLLHAYSFAEGSFEEVENSHCLSVQQQHDTVFKPLHIQGNDSGSVDVSFGSENSSVHDIVSFGEDFENLGQLGSGSFADVYKAKYLTDGKVYAVKRNRRRFRGRRDRIRAVTEARTMQRLSSAKGNQYIVRLHQAWQEDGYFFTQTELCSKHSCWQLMLSLTTEWMTAKMRYKSLLDHFPDENTVLIPEQTLWKICHDVTSGLSCIHSNNFVHHDIKPSNIFFKSDDKLGVLCKIGDFGMSGEIGSAEDGDEGDTTYMPLELLSSSLKHPSSDIFSLGMTLYELAAESTWELPSEGKRWHSLRNNDHVPQLPKERSLQLVNVIKSMISPSQSMRPTTEDIIKISQVKAAGEIEDLFLRDYVKDVREFEQKREQDMAAAHRAAIEQRFTPTGPILRGEHRSSWDNNAQLTECATPNVDDDDI